MKTNIINKLAALLTVSGLLSITAPLTVTAQNLTVSTGTAESGKTYSAVGNNAALTVSTSNGVYSGSNITLVSNLATTNGRMGLRTLTSSTVSLHDSAITVSDSTGYGIYMASASRINGDGIAIISNYSGIFVSASSVFSGTNINITADGNGAVGMQATTGGTVNVSALNVSVSGSNSRGVATAANSTMTVHGGTITISGQGDAYGVHVGGDANAMFTAYNLTVSASGGAYGLRSLDPGGMATLNDSQIQVADGHGVWVYNSGQLMLNNTNVTVSGSGMAAIRATGASAAKTNLSNIIVNGGTLAASDGDLINMTSDNTTAAINYHIELNGVITSNAGKFLNVSTNTGGMVNNIDVTLNNTDVAGGIATDRTSVVHVTASNSAISGDQSASGSAALTVTLNDSVYTGASAVSDNGIINLSLNNHANWNLTGKSKLTTLTSSGGSITIANVQGEDLIVSGGITGQTALNLTLSDSVKGDQEIWVVVDETNAMSNSAFVLGREVSAGMYQYELVNATDGAWLVYTGTVSGTTPPVDPPGPDIPPVVPPVPSGPPIISSEGDAIINTAAAVAGFWFTQLDNLHKRMGELRYNKPAGTDLINNVWVRAYGQQINANTGIYSVKGFSEIQYGVDLGTDYLWKLDADNQFYTGVFAGYGGADRQFHTSYNGSTDSGYGGLYATWLNNSGWYADVVAKGQYFRNEFSGADRGDYDSLGVGFSVEFGRQFEFKDGWFAEPSVQFSYLHLMNDNYTTRDGMGVTLSDADVLHIYGGARFGRNIKLTNSARLQPYIKAGGLGQISSGNTLTVSGDHWRPNLDGARAVVGAGVVWQLDADSQLHLDYEASFGEKYDKPWGVNFGYRYQF